MTKIRHGMRLGYGLLMFACALGMYIFVVSDGRSVFLVILSGGVVSSFRSSFFFRVPFGFTLLLIFCPFECYVVLSGSLASFAYSLVVVSCVASFNSFDMCGGPATCFDVCLASMYA